LGIKITVAEVVVFVACPARPQSPIKETKFK